MKTILFFSFSLISLYCFCQHQDTFESFIASDYPKEKYLITSDFIRFKDLIIEVRQVKNKSDYDPFSCRAWLIVSKKSKSIYERFFKSIEAVGSCYGLFVPLEQPHEDYFILSKLGDYDGRIFIIDSLGKVTENSGGVFYISKDKRYLFSDYYSDLSGLTVFDFAKGQTLFSDTIAPRLLNWYYQDNKYISNVDSSDEYYYFDLVTRKLVPIKLNSDYLKPEYQLGCYNEENSRRSCNCGFELQSE